MLLQGEKKMPHRSGFQPLSGMAIQIRIADQKLNSQPDIFIRDKSADGLRERLQLFITGDQLAVIITLDAPAARRSPFA
ncbi:hypothetical protein RBI80_19115 [Klebsiella variicola]|nr:hypothetical protein RBI80_19115 [Klebsiella variicola]